MTPYTDELQPPASDDRYSFYVRGEAAHVAKKLAALFDYDDNEGKATPIELSRAQRDALNKIDGLEADDISEFYYVQIQSNLMPVGKAIVIGYKSKPSKSQIIPASITNTIINPDNLVNLGFELVEK